MAACTLLGALLGMPLLSWPAFVSGIMAALVDLDTAGHPPRRSPAGHSVAVALVWSYLCWAVAWCLSPAYGAGTVLAAGSAFGTHLALDAFTDGGVFLWPRTTDPERWLEHYPPGRAYRVGNAGFLALGPGENEGCIAWSGWRAFAAGRDAGRPVPDQSTMLNIAVAAAGLAGMLAAVILS